MRLLSAVVALLLCVPGQAQDAVVTLRSTVTGSQDQPKVMYLLPWQQPGDAHFDNRVRGSFAEEMFLPIDRDEFRRGLQYQELLEETEND